MDSIGLNTADFMQISYFKAGYTIISIKRKALELVPQNLQLEY
jgi:hypothetical protein